MLIQVLEFHRKQNCLLIESGGAFFFFSLVSFVAFCSTRRISFIKSDYIITVLDNHFLSEDVI